MLILIVKLTLGDRVVPELLDVVTLTLLLEVSEGVILELELRDNVTVVLEVGDRVSVRKTEELKVADDVGDKEMDSDEDADLDVDSDDDPVSEDDTPRDLVREVVMEVVMEGEAEAVALIDGVEARVAERERLWLWVNVDDPDPDTVAIEDMVMELLEDMDTLSDEEGVSLEDVVNDEVPEML